ncbi:MAG: hypothetical protein R3299_00305 [Arenibacter sp.]|nr:hypothetical protein [Arenibacter sp.]
MAAHWGIWYFILADVGVAYFSIWFAILTIKQLMRLLLLKYDAPIAKLQEDLACLQIAIVHNLRIAA